MVGRDVIFSLDKKPGNPEDVVLEVNDIYAENDKGLPALRGVSLNVRAGEIVGVAGVAGNGQSEISQVISGMRQCKQGQVLLNGDNVSNHTTLFGIQHGMAYVPEDRTHVGSAPNLSITDNVIMKKYRKPPISNDGMLDMKVATKLANELKAAYDIIVPNVSTPVRLLVWRKSSTCDPGARDFRVACFYGCGSTYPWVGCRRDRRSSPFATCPARGGRGCPADL